MFMIKLAEQTVESKPQFPERCARCGCEGFHKWGRAKARQITDVNITEVWTQRYRCKNCGKTFTSRPKGIGRTGRSHSFMGLLAVLYGLGLSHRSVEKVVGLFGHPTDHMSVWRDIQRLGKLLRDRPKGKAKVVGVDETWMKVKGKSRPIGVVLDVGGRQLGIELTGPRFDYERWFKSMSDELGVQVVVTDDSKDYSVPIDESGLSRQQCMVHMKRTLRRSIGRLKADARDSFSPLIDQIKKLVTELPDNGADRLRNWARSRDLPDELRWLVVHLLERWRQMTVHQHRLDVPQNTNWVEGRFGRIKPRYRMTRGLKTDSGAANFMAVVCDVLA